MWEDWKDKYPNTFEAFQYAQDVVDEKIPACIHAYNSCIRALDDLDRIQSDEDCPFFFDPEKSERYLRLVQKFKHVKGANWKSPYIIYEPWQKFPFACIMGFMNSITTRRRFRSAYLEFPRGNGKALVDETIVHTPYGMKHYKNIKVGDVILSEHGFCNVVGKNNYHKCRAYDVVLGDGSSFTCSREHLWPVMILVKDRFKEKIVETIDMLRLLKKEDVYLRTDMGLIKVDSVSPLNKKILMFCIEVDSPNNTFFIGKNKVTTHNSAMASQGGLYFTSLEGELGPQVICASTKKEAARIVFDDAKAMANANESFIKKTGTKVYAHHIAHVKSNGIMKPVSSKSNSLDGLNPSLTVGDEMHEWQRKLYDVIDSSLTKRDDSLFLMITTAGLSTEGIGYELSYYTKKVLSSEVEDDTWFGMIHTIDEGDDWLDPNVWKKANPNWGVSVDPINFEAKAKKAQETPASKYNFMVKHLNQWQNTASPYFSLNLWDKGFNPKLKFSDFVNKSCFGALDIGNKIDLCSNVYIFNENGKFQIFDFSWIPEARIMDNRNVKYAEWIKKKYLLSMPGEVINYETLQNFVIKVNRQIKTQELFYDPWSATETSQVLGKSGISMTEFKMSTANLSEAMKKLDAEIRKGNVEHNGSPLLRWCLGNVVSKEDANENVFPRKLHERLKIDPIVAAIMCMAGYISHEENESPYNSRGIIVV